MCIHLNFLVRLTFILFLLRVTMKLRFYSKKYVQDFMAEAVSFLLRNAPVDQLREGIM